MNLLERYGIKEVADVVFYNINSDGSQGSPVLYLDTLKVSTIEQTAENTSAKGGKGNPDLIMWDYGKEINVTLEDALFSMKSMAIMFGDSEADTSGTSVKKTIVWTCDSTVTSFPSSVPWYKPDGTQTFATGGSWYDAASGSSMSASATPTSGNTYYYTFDLTSSVATIDISAQSFPGTYYVCGDTYARSESTGKDEFFQFVIPKAKVLSENTITMEAEGDPSTFSMNLRVLRPSDGKMMQLKKYTVS